jgi:hypothetical protein
MINEIPDIPPDMRKIYLRLRRWRSSHARRVPLQDSLWAAKGLSQGDIEHRTGFLRCYVSRVENGHTVMMSASQRRGNWRTSDGKTLFAFDSRPTYR